MVSVTDDPETVGGAALVVGASGGVGAAFVRRLRADPAYATVRTLSRRDDGFDLGDECAIAAAAAHFRASALRFTCIIVATGILEADGRRPEKSFSEIDPAAMAQVFATNAIGPALVFKHFSSLLEPQGRSVFAVLSARVGSIGDNRLGGWTSYRASKSALNQIVRSAAIEIARTRPEAVVVALHPGTIETAMTRAHARAYTASADDAAGQMLHALARLAPTDSGGFFAYDGQGIAW